MATLESVSAGTFIYAAHATARRVERIPTVLHGPVDGQLQIATRLRLIQSL